MERKSQGRQHARQRWLKDGAVSPTIGGGRTHLGIGAISPTIDFRFELVEVERVDDVKKLEGLVDELGIIDPRAHRFSELRPERDKGLLIRENKAPKRTVTNLQKWFDRKSTRLNSSH